MAFELKVIENIHCPRCNAWAEVRLDKSQLGSDSEMILTFIVCSTCRLNKYFGVTTKKAIKIISKINKLKKLAENYDEESPARQRINDKIYKLEKLRRKAETLT